MKVLRGGRLIDGTGAAPIEGTTIVLRDNRIEADAVMPGASAQAGCVLVECSHGLHLGGNSWKSGAGQVLPGVVYDPATVQDLDAAGNRLVGE